MIINYYLKNCLNFILSLFKTDNYEFGEFIYVNPGNASVLQKETCPTNNYDPFGPKLIAEYQCKIEKGFCKKIVSSTIIHF